MHVFINFMRELFYERAYSMISTKLTPASGKQTEISAESVIHVP